MKKKEFDMERFAELVVGEFQNIHQEFKNIHQEFTNIHQEFQSLHHVIDNVKSDIHDIRAEMRDVHQSQDRMEAQLENHSGFAKGIDHVLGRVVRIEKHVCLEEK